MNIAVAGTGYVGLSIATLLAQHNHVTAVDVIPEKVELINQKKSPIQDVEADRQASPAIIQSLSRGKLLFGAQRAFPPDPRPRKA